LPRVAGGSVDRGAGLLLIVALVLFFVALGCVAPFSRFNEAYDLNVYRNGAIAVLHGGEPYSEPSHYVGPYFTYPPFAALAFTPLALLSLGADRILAIGGSLVCLLLLALLAVRAEHPVRLDDPALWTVVLAVAAVGLLLEPVISTLGFGQINLLLAVLVAADLLARRRILPQGVLVGIAAGVKLVPGLFIVYLLLTRQLRAAAWMAGTFAVTVAFGFAVMPAAAWTYWTRYAIDPSRAGHIGYVGNQSLQAALARLLCNQHEARTLWLVFGLASVAAGLFIGVRLHSHGRELAAMCAVALAGLLASPISWDHHWVWALPVAVLLLIGRDTAGRRFWTTIGVLWCLLFCLAPIWWVPNPFAPVPHSVGLLLSSNSYAIAGVLMLFALGVLAHRIEARSRLG
jgi:alpha-1,2-mannosyltransferase